MTFGKSLMSCLILVLVVASTVSTLSLEKPCDGNQAIRLQSLNPPTDMLVKRRLLDDQAEQQNTDDGDDGDDGDQDDSNSFLDQTQDVLEGGKESVEEGYSWWKEQSTGVKVAVILAVIVAFSAIVSIISCFCGCLKCLCLPCKACCK